MLYTAAAPQDAGNLESLKGFAVFRAFFGFMAWGLRV